MSCVFLGLPAGTRETPWLPENWVSGRMTSFCVHLQALRGEREMTPGSSQEGGLDQRLLVCSGECLPSHRRDCGDSFPSTEGTVVIWYQGTVLWSAHADLKTSPISRLHLVTSEASNTAMCSLL